MDESHHWRPLGEAIRDRRRELGWTQEELAARASTFPGEVRQSDVSRLERGKVGLPRRARLERIARALGLPLGELLAGSGWVGADAAFSPAEVVPDVEPSPVARPLAVPSGRPPAPARPRAGRSPDLGAAIARSRELETWSAEILSRSQATFERANRSPGRPPAPLAPPETAEGDEVRNGSPGGG